MASTGRNDPCPCGSGRKFKQCCLRERDAEDAARIRLRTAEGLLIPALFAYAAAEFGPEFVEHAWEEFFLWEDVPEEIESSREFGTTFDPFFVFSFVPDPADDLPDGWPTEPLALHFLHHEVESCPDEQRAFIEQACRSPASFFVIEAAAPGRTIDLRDILTGRRFQVLEQSASRTLQIGDLTFTRVVTVGGASIMIGASPWILPPSWHVPIIDRREELRPRGLLTRADLADYDIEIREWYRDIVEAILHPRLPTLQNTDGDPIELTTLTYALSVPEGDAIDRLRALATLRGELHINDEPDEEGVSAVTLTWLKAGNRAHKGWDNTTLGTLRIGGSRLVVSVNSARRRLRIEKEIGKRLGPGATLVDVIITDLARELEARRTARAAAGPSNAEPDPQDEPRAPELEALEAQLAERQWLSWIDTKVPALGNRTPRQAAKTPRGRERLEALLTDLARSVGRRPASAPNVAELRRRLGLA